MDANRRVGSGNGVGHFHAKNAKKKSGVFEWGWIYCSGLCAGIEGAKMTLSSTKFFRPQVRYPNAYRARWKQLLGTVDKQDFGTVALGEGDAQGVGRLGHDDFGFDACKNVLVTILDISWIYIHMTSWVYICI